MQKVPMESNRMSDKTTDTGKGRTVICECSKTHAPSLICGSKKRDSRIQQRICLGQEMGIKTLHSTEH